MYKIIRPANLFMYNMYTAAYNIIVLNTKVEDRLTVKCIVHITTSRSRQIVFAYYMTNDNTFIIIIITLFGIIFLF